MPNYVYKCKKCQFEWDDTKKIEERYETNCPNCGPECIGKKNIEIIPQLSNFIIKIK
jgi:putative FmdB family regulatory protein